MKNNRFEVITNEHYDDAQYIADEDIEIALDFRFGLTENMNAFEAERGRRANEQLDTLFDDFINMKLE